MMEEECVVNTIALLHGENRWRLTKYINNGYDIYISM